MKITLKNRLLFVITALVIVGLVSIVLVNDYNEDRQELRLAQSYLHQDKLDKAEVLFSSLENSLWVKRPARLGSLMVKLAGNRDYPDMPLPGKTAVKIEDFHLLTLLKRLYISNAFKNCAKLAEIGMYYGVNVSALYYSAALLEIGEFAAAYRYYYDLPERLKNTILGIRLKETFALINGGAVRIVRDRTGKLIGTIDASGEFEFYQPGYKALIQPVILRNILHAATSNGIRATIDLELSQLALESLGENQGSIVLVKPDTGEILAAVSDGKTIKKMGEYSSPAFEQMLEPASIQKLITVTASYRNGLDPETEIAGMACRGVKYYDKKALFCPSARGKLYDLEQAMATSCNTAFADLGVKLGWEKMLAELRLFGFDSTMKNPFSLGKIIINEGDQRVLADLSIGLEDTVISPVHAALIAAVFANNGFWVNPELVYAGDGLTGFSPKRITSAAPVKILEKQWLPSIKRAMWAVSRWGGTASFIAPWDFQVHMKTGTSGNYQEGFHINYIGYGPEDKGSIVFCVRVTNKRTSTRARRAGFDVNQKLLILLKEIAQEREGHFWE